MQNPNRTKITLKMIAEKAETSIGTVDRAINNRDGISEQSRQRILEIAKEMGYRPNKFASALSRKRTIRIGVVFPEISQDFYSIIDRGVIDAAKDLADYGVTVERIRYHSQDPQVAYDALRAIDLSQFDGLALNNAGGISEQFIGAAIAQGTSIITFNTDAPDTRRLFYVGSNSRQSGRMGGELMGMLLGGKGNVAVIGNFARTTPFVERFGGFCEYLQPNFPEIKMYPCSECYSDIELAAKTVIDLLDRSPEIGGLFCTGYTSTIGTIQALKQLGRADIILIGYDVTDQTAQALKENWLTAVIYQDPYQQGYQAAHLLAKHLLEDWVPEKPRLHIENRIVLRSNLDGVLSASNGDEQPLFEHSNPNF